MKAFPNERPDISVSPTEQFNVSSLKELSRAHVKVVGKIDKRPAIESSVRIIADNLYRIQLMMMLIVL